MRGAPYCLAANRTAFTGSAMSSPSHIDTLLAARQVANFASEQGAHNLAYQRRDTYTHIGAVLADSVLQAGLNYNSVVRPRIQRIISAYPDADSVVRLMTLVRSEQTCELLDWRHPVKQKRFEDVVMFCNESNIDDVDDLRSHLMTDDFCIEIQNINGVGPKTVDYMACLVGIDTVAVDRHIRSFAATVGVVQTDYAFLKRAFCFAADFLSISRRDFDAWIWFRESNSSNPQLQFSFEMNAAL